MSITLTLGAVTLALDPDLMWTDENDWFPVEQSLQRSITGALLVSVATRLAGRPITLQPEDDSSAWMPAADLAQLKAWAAIPGQALQLSLRGQTRSVIFRHHDSPALEANPVVHYQDVEPGDWYRVNLRFMEI